VATKVKVFEIVLQPGQRRRGLDELEPLVNFFISAISVDSVVNYSYHSHFNVPPITLSIAFIDTIVLNSELR
jgi:hypothetical protein